MHSSVAFIKHLDTVWQDNIVVCSCILKNELAKIAQGCFFQLNIAHHARKIVVCNCQPPKCKLFEAKAYWFAMKRKFWHSLLKSCFAKELLPVSNVYRTS